MAGVRVYTMLSPIYDVLFGRVLQPGRVAAVARMGDRPIRVLEVGVGTALNAPLYSPRQKVIGIDLSASMLAKGRERIAREGLDHVQLVRMDAAHLAFADNAFDIVYAPYTLSVVPEPIEVAREMRRVCRVGGTILIANHFQSTHPLIARLERFLTPLMMHVGFRCDLNLSHVLRGSNLWPASIDAINAPPFWRLVTCYKESA